MASFWVWVCALLGLARAHTTNQPPVAHHCVHDQVAQEVVFGEGDPQVKANTKQTYAAMRITYVIDQGSVTDQDVAVTDAEFGAAVDRIQGFLSVERLAVLTAAPSTCIGFDYSEYAGTYTNTDLLIFVTFEPVSSQYTLAWAAACKFDATSDNRPYIGRVNVNPDLIGSEPQSYRVSVMIHEMMHVLVFSPNLFKPLGFHEAFTKSDGQQNSRITAPTVRAEAEDHFGCASVDGIELAYYEYNPSSNTPGGHWDKEFMGPELMTGFVEHPYAISRMTLGFLHDTPWYEVDLDAADDFAFGRQQGCTFLNDRCNFRDSQYFCTASVEGCNAVRSGVGYCTFADPAASSIPSFFQYFSSPTAGGRYIENYCPIVQHYSNGICEDPDMEIFSSSSTQAIVGVYVGEGSKCFDSTAIQFGYSGYSRNLRCHRHECGETSLVIYIGSSFNYPITCPTGGGSVNLALAYPAQWSGVLTCPPFEELCYTTAAPDPSKSSSVSRSHSPAPSASPSPSRMPSPSPSRTPSPSPSTSLNCNGAMSLHLLSTLSFDPNSGRPVQRCGA